VTIKSVTRLGIRHGVEVITTIDWLNDHFRWDATPNNVSVRDT